MLPGSPGSPKLGGDSHSTHQVSRRVSTDDMIEDHGPGALGEGTPRCGDAATSGCFTGRTATLGGMIPRCVPLPNRVPGVLPPRPLVTSALWRACFQGTNDPERRVTDPYGRPLAGTHWITPAGRSGPPCEQHARPRTVRALAGETGSPRSTPYSSSPVSGSGPGSLTRCPITEISVANTDGTA